MSAPIRTKTIAGVLRSASHFRTISTTVPVAAAAEASTSKRPQTRRQPLAEYDIRKMEEFKFDDATSLGFMRLEKIREAQELVKRVEADKAALQGMSSEYGANSCRSKWTLDRETQRTGNASGIVSELCIGLESAIADLAVASRSDRVLICVA